MISNQRRAAWLGTAALLGTAAFQFSARAAHAQEAPAAAPQPPPARRGGGGQGGGNRQGMQNPVMGAFAATKPTPDQQTKFDALSMAMRTEMRAAMQNGPDPAKMTTINTKFRDDVKALLTDDQKKVFDTEMAKAPMMGGGGGIMGQLAPLMLTDDQKAKINPLIADTQKQIAALPQADRRAKAPELLADLKTKIRPILTADQQTKLDGMTLRQGGRGGGRRPGGAGGPGGQGGPGAPPPPPAAAPAAL